MIVSRIEEVSKNRSRVFLDGRAAFVLYRGELRKYGILEEKELPEDLYREIMEQVLPKRAKLRAMHLLQGRAYTEKQLMDKLLQSGYDEETAALAAAYVKSFHYLDDKEYVRNYLACHMQRMSRKEMERRLLQKGIDRELFREVFQEEEQSGGALEEEELILRLLEKKHFSGKDADQKEKQRILGYFYRRGFSVGQVMHIIDNSFT